MMKKIISSILFAGFFLSIVCSAQVVKVADFSIKISDGTELVSLKKNGQVNVINIPIGELRSDGSLRDLNGKMLLTIDKQGKIINANKKTVGIIDDNGFIDIGSGEKIGWTEDGKLHTSKNEFLTITPNDKKFYKTATFLLLTHILGIDKSESPIESQETETTQFDYKDTDIVASFVTNSGGRYPSDNSITVYGDGKIDYTSFKSIGNAGKKIKTTKAKINLLLQKADELRFTNTESGFTNLEPIAPKPFVHDALSYTMQVWYKGKLKKTTWSTGDDIPQEINDFISFFNKLFEPEIKEING